MGKIKYNKEQKAIVTALLSEHKPWAEITAITGVNPNTINQVKRDNNTLIQENRKIIAKNAGLIAIAAQKSITMQKLDKSSAAQLAVIARESTYTGQMVSGEPTEIIEHRHRIDQANDDDLLKIIEAENIEDAILSSDKPPIIKEGSEKPVEIEPPKSASIDQNESKK